MWNEALSYSGVAGAVWSGIAILANDSSLSPGRGTIDSANKYVKLGPGSARYPISDVHHESGHLVHYLANTSLKWATMYNYPTSCTSGGCSGDGHSLDTPEWKAAGFPEGLASFIGTVASYWYWASQPQFCINSLTPCGSTGWNQEVRPAGACVTDEDRFELSAQRYLWDVYDSVDDAAYADTIGADTSNSFWYGALIDELATFGAGTGNGQINEPWNAALMSIDSHDGRSAADFQAKINESTTTQRSNNCNP